jgi:hypothetical protein
MAEVSGLMIPPSTLENLELLVEEFVLPYYIFIFMHENYSKEKKIHTRCIGQNKVLTYEDDLDDFGTVFEGSTVPCLYKQYSRRFGFKSISFQADEAREWFSQLNLTMVFQNSSE